jgi:hypothetical protein
MADTLDSKSNALTGVRVQVPPPVPYSYSLFRQRKAAFFVAFFTLLTALEGSSRIFTEAILISAAHHSSSEFSLEEKLAAFSLFEKKRRKCV